MYDDLSPQDKAKYVCALRAAEFVKSGMKVGLGTGSTAYWLVKHLGQSVRNGDLIKGGGGAHLQEKVVAMASDQMIVIADASKRVETLGKFPLPIEVLQFGSDATQKLIANLLVAQGYQGIEITCRMAGDAPFVTDEGNFILDLHMGQIADAKALASAINQIPGVVENGLFIDICSAVVVGNADGSVRTELKSGADAEVRQMMGDTNENLFSDIES
ncbi:MAG: ribose 5-phosphate isomerase A [Rhodobacteraceae bacterium]|nr:ribose 5-phosphate isomerase A [Paracoccaceae bacterium]